MIYDLQPGGDCLLAPSGRAVRMKFAHQEGETKEDSSGMNQCHLQGGEWKAAAREKGAGAVYAKGTEETLLYFQVAEAHAHDASGRSCGSSLLSSAATFTIRMGQAGVGAAPAGGSVTLSTVTTE